MCVYVSFATGPWDLVILMEHVSCFFPGGPFLEGPGPFGFCLLLEYYLLLISDTLHWSGALAMSIFSFYQVPSMLGISIWQFHWLG